MNLDNYSREMGALEWGQGSVCEAANESRACLLGVNLDTWGPTPSPAHVRFALEAIRLLRSSEMTRRAFCCRERVQQRFAQDGLTRSPRRRWRGGSVTRRGRAPWRS